MNILSNYDKNYTGVISIDEKMNKVDYLDMPVAYAMDQPSFFNELTIYENLLLIASSRKIKKSAGIYSTILFQFEIQSGC